jgi:DNA-3-methyladenine glycosylase II
MPQDKSGARLDRRTFRAALAELGRADPGLNAIMIKWGSPPFWTHPAGFAGLVLAILGQQVSIESAQAAFDKLGAVLGEIEPRAFLTLNLRQLKRVGFSRQKAGYVRGIASALVRKELDLARLGRLNDERARSQLMLIRGIGAWTADTYLLFSLKRPDVWPSGDLALAKAIQSIKGRREVPRWDEVDQLAAGWRPWRAVAARILWHGYLSERGR